MPNLSPERLGALNSAKLRALVRDHFGAEVEPTGSGAAATATIDGIGWVLIADDAGRGLGGAMAWANRHEISELHVLVDADAGVIARQATAFAVPPRVWQVNDRDLVAAESRPIPAAPEASDPDDLSESDASSDAPAVDFEQIITDSGADVIREHGVVTGEAFGLEIARVVEDDLGRRLEVGIGRHDREAFTMVHGQNPDVDTLREVVDVARQHRSRGAAPHALNRISMSKRLRWFVLENPEIVGAAALSAISTPLVAESLNDELPAAASGVDAEGKPLVAVCYVGIMLDLVAIAADTRLHIDPQAELVLVMPERDALPVIKAMATALDRPARIVTHDVSVP